MDFHVELSEKSCDYCKIPFHKTCSYSKLDCGHIFHVLCFHQKVAHMYPSCPVCGVKMPVNTEFQQYLPLNCGDDFLVNNYLNKFEVINTMFSGSSTRTKKGSNLVFTGMLDAEYSQSNQANKLVGATQNLQYGIMSEGGGNQSKVVRLGKNLDNFFLKFVEIAEREKTYGNEIESDPFTLIGNRRPSNELRFQKNIDFKSLIKSKVTIEFILKNGYTLLDLIILGATLSDLIIIRFDAKIWKTYRDVLPYNDMLSTFHLHFGEIFTCFCQEDVAKFAWLDFTLDQLKKIQCNMMLLLDVGLVKHHMPLFTNLTVRDWATLGLTFGIMKTILVITKNDLKSILRWTADPALDQPFRVSFKQIFGYTVDELTNREIQTQTTYVQ